MALNRTFKLKNGSIMPAFGLGTWKSETNIVGTAVKEALNVGVKLIDCAAVYENEKEIGAVLSTLPRSSFFVTSKLWNSMHDPQDVEPAVRRTLADLGLEYLDLYLIHWPVALVPKRDGTSDSARDPVTGKFMVNHNVTLEQTWKAMEALVDKGLVKSIGCSNFSIPKLKQILSIARIHPVVDQVEMHPFLPQDDLVQFGKENDIVIQAYAPFGSGKTPSLLEHEKIVEVAKKNGKTPAQVLVSWAIQRGTSVIPKSSNPERIRENFQDFILPDEDFKTISEIHLTTPIRFFDPKDWWGVAVF